MRAHFKLGPENQSQIFGTTSLPANICLSPWMADDGEGERGKWGKRKRETERGIERDARWLARVEGTDTVTDTDTFVYLSTSWLARKLMVKPSVTLVALGCQRGRVANVANVSR